MLRMCVKFWAYFFLKKKIQMIIEVIVVSQAL